MATKTQSTKPARAPAKSSARKAASITARARTPPRPSAPGPRSRKSVASSELAPIPTPSRGNKQALLLTLLRSANGATVVQMAQATGWQHHTIRGTISGVLRKKMKLNVVTEKADGGAIYRVIESSPKA